MEQRVRFAGAARLVRGQWPRRAAVGFAFTLAGLGSALAPSAFFAAAQAGPGRGWVGGAAGRPCSQKDPLSLWGKRASCWPRDPGRGRVARSRRPSRHPPGRRPRGEMIALTTRGGGGHEESDACEAVDLDEEGGDTEAEGLLAGRWHDHRGGAAAARPAAEEEEEPAQAGPGSLRLERRLTQESIGSIPARMLRRCGTRGPRLRRRGPSTPRDPSFRATSG